MHPINKETEQFTSTLLPQLVNKQYESSILLRCPHEDISPEIAVIVVSGEGRTPVTYSDATSHQLTQNELMTIAKQNQENSPYYLSSIENMCGLESEDSGQVQLLVLTNMEAYLGSAEILNSVAMREASDRLEAEQLYIIPSSTHEVIMLPRDSGVTPDQLDAIIHEINRSIVQAHEHLAEHSLVYDHRMQSLSEARAQYSGIKKTDTKCIDNSNAKSIDSSPFSASYDGATITHERHHT